MHGDGVTPYNLIESFALSRGYNAETISRLVDRTQTLNNIGEIRDLVGPDLVFLFNNRHLGLKMIKV